MAVTPKIFIGGVAGVEEEIVKVGSIDTDGLTVAQLAGAH